MTEVQPPDIKQNVRRFDEDVRKQGAYAYTETVYRRSSQMVE